MKITKKAITNIAFVILIGLLIYPDSRAYFIRLISFAPSVENVEDREGVDYNNWFLTGLNTPSVGVNELEDKVLFVSLWATWCGPCIAEMPTMKKLYEDYKDKVVFLFITRENWQTVATFYKKSNYDFPAYNSNNGMPSEIFSQSIPATYIIGADQKIAIKKIGTANWNSERVRKTLDGLLEKMPEATN
ncbi:TlpA disulfide reductase family protein [Flavobacteriaceae bacterium S356]|uniref:TlpA disulfide reductase family protein n=1 Tax=Asprobacillus argus TaxID=3076534 RepID=A0ABU3LES7_9FLAO|nr:TlpA disulfide reductase family protein [Flavobacteriaceae bacterium S356]